MKLIKMDQIFLYCVESREHNDANYFVFLEDNIFFLSIAISEVFFRREFFYPQLCVLIFFMASFAEVQIGLSEAFQIIFKII